VVAKALGGSVSKEQMMFWMTERCEISILDYIFNQQDRPGNIDYIWQSYYVSEQGLVKTAPLKSRVSRPNMTSIRTSKTVKNSHKYYLIQKTQLNDNDSGGRRSYTNFTREFRLLEKIRHLNHTTYRQLIRMANDFRVKGPLYNYLRDTFDLSDNYTDMIAQNTMAAAEILKKSCDTRSIRFDLDPERYLMTGQSETVQVDCDNP